MKARVISVLGALDYLQKPFEIDELLVVVRRATAATMSAAAVAMIVTALL